MEKSKEKLPRFCRTLNG
jgi:hypothetical protein